MFSRPEARLRPGFPTQHHPLRRLWSITCGSSTTLESNRFQRRSSAFQSVSKKRLQEGQPRQMMRRANTVFLLEGLLQRYVYGRPLELKREPELRDAVLALLDLLVENGSS